MAKRNLVEWLKSGEYLPSFLRDFHDQKDLFKRVEWLAAAQYQTEIPGLAGTFTPLIISFGLWLATGTHYRSPGSRLSLKITIKLSASGERQVLTPRLR